jgi:hypothetical protein
MDVGNEIESIWPVPFSYAGPLCWPYDLVVLTTILKSSCELETIVLQAKSMNNYTHYKKQAQLAENSLLIVSLTKKNIRE